MITAFGCAHTHALNCTLSRACRLTYIFIPLIFQRPSLSGISKKKKKKKTREGEQINVLLQYYTGSNPRWSTMVTMSKYPSTHPGVPGSNRYWPSQQCRSENTLPCGAQMSKELSSLAPLSVNRPPACTYLQVRIKPPAEFSKALTSDPRFCIHLLLLLCLRWKETLVLLGWQKRKYGHQITHLNRYGNIKIGGLDYFILQHMVAEIMHVPPLAHTEYV